MKLILVSAFKLMTRYGMPPLIAWGILSLIYLVGVAIGSISWDIWIILKEAARRGSAV